MHAAYGSWLDLILCSCKTDVIWQARLTYRATQAQIVILNHSPMNFRKSLFLSILDIWGLIPTYFLTLIPNHPAWRRVKMQPWGVMGEKLILMWSRDQFSAKREKRFHFSVGLGFGIGLGLGYDSGYWLGLGFGLGSGFGPEIRAQGLQKWCHVTAHWRVI